MAVVDTDVPPWAALLWHNGTDLFLQLPQSGHITKLSLTEGGLSKALKLIAKPCRAPNHTMLVAKPSKAKKLERNDDDMAAEIRRIMRK